MIELGHLQYCGDCSTARIASTSITSWSAMVTDHSPTRLIDWWLLLHCMSPVVALFGPDRPDWRRLFLRVKRTSQLRTQTSEFDPTETSSLITCEAGAICSWLAGRKVLGFGGCARLAFKG